MDLPRSPEVSHQPGGLDGRTRLRRCLSTEQRTSLPTKIPEEDELGQNPLTLSDALLVRPAANTARRFVFVGEKRSRKAIALGVTWEDGRLAAKTLHEALRAVGLDPDEQRFLNLYLDHLPGVVNPDALDQIRKLLRDGWVIVGLGRVVQAGLKRLGIPHRPLVHPAARGAIRSRARYQRHVAWVLGRHLPLERDA